MGNRAIHPCQCRECQEENETKREYPKHLNLLMSRLNEQQRRWMAALEATRSGHGGTQRVTEITGLDINTIRRGRRELDGGLDQCPVERIRVSGGGRKQVEKN